MSSPDLAYLTATDAVAAFRAKTLSPVELMRATIEQIEATEPSVGALADTFFDQALEQAKDAEARYVAGSPSGALDGIPVAIKDELPVAGQRCTSGSLVYQDYVADHTAPLAERVIAAGGIIHVRTRTPEFSCAPFTHSRLWGVSHNPWNPAYDVGGSSGGSGAALAAGMTPLASGSDIGGSIRIPASCCGVVGFKPPYGRVPQEPPFNLDHYCHEGPMARTVADCAMFQNVIAGPHPCDVVSLRPKLEIPELSTLRQDLAGVRIAYSIDLGGFPVTADVAANTRAAVERFREAGATVEEVAFAWSVADVIRASWIHYGAVFGPLVAAIAAEHADAMTDYALAFAREAAMYAVPGMFYEGLEIEGAVYREIGAVLDRFDLLICPTIGLPALEAGVSYVDRAVMVEGREQNLIDHMLTIVFNICSRCPVLSVPSGFSLDGVPTGISIVGRSYDDIAVFEAAAVFERTQPWLDAPARRPLQVG